MFSKSLILRNYFSLLDSKLLDLWGSALKQIARGWGMLLLSMCLAGSVMAAEPAKSTTAAAAKKPVAQAQRNKAKAKTKTKAPVKARVDTRPSFGKVAGLHDVSDELSLKSSVALVVDQETQEVLLSKNDSAVLPIASITKLMTALLINDAQLPMDEMITITQDDVDTEKGSRSRLQVGASLARGELLHLALMASENRAAHALGRTYPGGLQVFVGLMNLKAKDMGMTDTRFVEPTGLSSKNQSSAKDLVTLVQTAYREPLLRDLSTSDSHVVDVGRHSLIYKTTNRLINNPSWDIGLQKTGYISEAGQCLVMQTKIAGRKLIMVFLDSAGKFSRIADAERVRRWVEAKHRAVIPQT
jgi:D-alanyl-D-alanine endopeptidase (penicillin-binding protein 7)